MQKTLAHQFKTFYHIHGLMQYPWWRQWYYLHYALFLRALTDRTSPVTREKITALKTFADIAGQPPPPESRLLQPAYIVPYLVLLNVLIAEVLKQTELLKGWMGVLILYLCFAVIWIGYFVLRTWHVVTSSGHTVDRTIQRFLQWAKRDLAEEQTLSTQRLRANVPDPHGPAY